MATQLQGTLLKSSIGVNSIRKSVMSFNKSIVSAQKTTVKINQSIAQSNRQKQRSISIASTNFQRRRESVRRREREDIVEASSVGGAIKRQGKVIAASTKGFLGRIMDFVGTVAVGWLLTNLPTIIRLGEQLIERGGKLLGVLRSFISNVTTILSGFGGFLVGTFRNLIGFDFTGQKQLIDNTLSTIQTGMIGIENDINSAISLLTAPLDLGFDQLDFDEGGPPPGAPEDVPTGGTGIEAISKFIAKAETGGRYDAYSGDGGKGDPNIPKMTLTQLKQKYPGTAVGAHQFMPDTAIGLAKQMKLDPNKVVFSPQFQDQLNQYHLRQMGYDKFMSGKITQQQFGTAIAQQYRALPDPRTGKTYADKYAKDNRATVTLSEFNAVLKQAKEKPAQVTPTPVTPLPRSRVKDEINVSGPSGGTREVGLSREEGAKYGAYRSSTRSHAGIDIGTSGQKGWLVGFKASGTVIRAGDGGGYGNLVVIKSGNTQYYFAHLARIFVKLGPYNGEVIGEIGNTGGNWPIHLHYEVRPNGNPIDPKPYLNLLDIGRETVAPQTAAKPATPTGIQIASATPASTQTATQVTPERKGQVIFLPMPETQVAQAPPPVQSSKGGMGLSAPSESGLNNIGSIQLNQLA